MYLWIVIATFIVALFSYNLSVHPETDRIYAETRANTVAASFQIQHNALVSYVQSVGGHLNGEQFTQDENGTNIPSNAYLSGTYYSQNKFSQGSGVLSDSGINDFLPLGFEPDPQTISKIYCFKRFDMPIVPETPSTESESSLETDAQGFDTVTVDPVTGLYPFDYSSADASCTQENKVVLVSWRPIPQKWVNRQNNSLPAPDMIHAIARSNGYSTTFGYTVVNDGDYYISGGEHKIYEAVVHDSTKPNLSDSCSEHHPCFVSISQIKY